MTDIALPSPEKSAAPTARRRGGLGGGRGALFAATFAVAALVAVPLLAVVASIASPSWDNLAHIRDTVLGEIVVNTLGIMVLVGLGVAVVGVATAWLVTMTRFPGSRALEVLLLLPLAFPAYIIGYAYTDALTYAGPIQSALRAAFGWSRGDYWFPDIHSLWGASLMLVLVLYPYVYLLARTAFLDQSTCVLEASRTLGAGPWRGFLSVGLPLARPAVAAGVALALMEALADFGTVQYFGVTTFTTTIYRTWFGMGDRMAASQLASGLLVVVLALVAMEYFSRRSAPHASARRHRVHAAPRLKGLAAFGALVACALPVVLGFVLPVLALMRLNAEGGDPFLGPRFLAYAGHSLVLATIAAVVVVAAAAVVAYATRLAPGRASATLVRVASLGYAVPGTVIAVGVLIPLGALDGLVAGLSKALGGTGASLLLSGSIIALVYAYLVRFLAVAAGPIEAGLGKIPHSLDHAARTLGLAGAGLARHVHAPLLKRSLLTAGLLVFVEVLKELPATLIVRPFDFDTLAVRVYNLASDERLAQASTGSLAIVAMGLLPVIVLTRMIASERKGARG